ncbi:hypothetical protein SS50377_23715 [Spironucleus salmonicida]|uniref:Uncharacterized protein n=1 Tax=Spironucleus salmonicida TaxID=348837 RepID=V6LZW2_9EUKA|nr:hypothetical protein SS50377_23715 [Spironucleus salmonicida]|eukprot:EST46394.1 hypothetical protein SS50377_13478 [Spironucleus salmonicida]
MLTIRVRAPSGQKNFVVEQDKPIITFLNVIAQNYQLTASKIAGRLYTDFSFKTAVFSTNLDKKSQVQDFFKHGQLIFLKQPPQEEQITVPFEQKVKAMAFEELQELIRKPISGYKTKSCTHPQSILCLKCLAEWEVYILELANMSKLQFDNIKLQKQASTTNTKKITDIRLETQDQLVIKYQATPKIKTTLISTSVGQSITNLAQQFSFNIELTATLFGIENRVFACAFPFFESKAGKISQKQGPLFSEINALISKIALFNFGLSPIGIAFLTPKRQFSAKNIVHSLHAQSQILLHAQLINISSPSQQRENAFLEQKFQMLNGQTQKIIIKQTKCDGVKIEAFELSQQIQFLWERKVVNELQQPGFEVQFNKKQIINDAFLDKIDTDAFIVSVGVQNSADFVNQEGNKENIGQMVENLMDFVFMQQFCQVDDMFLTVQKVGELAKNNKSIREIILGLLKQSQLKIVNDLSFLACIVLSGVLTEAEVVGKKQQDILALLEKKL